VLTLVPCAVCSLPTYNMRTCASCSATGVVVCDWAAQAFLRAEGGGVGRTARTAWCFLSELESSGVPSKVADYVRDTTHTALETRAEADVQLRRGHLAIYKEMLDACDAMAAGRSQLMDRFLVSTPQLSALQAWRASQEQRASQAGERAAAIESLARRVASALWRDHHAIVDDFLPAPFCAARRCGAMCLGSAAAVARGLTPGSGASSALKRGAPV
jgi:hypothetical protein